MLTDFWTMLNQHGISINGIIHVGGYFGEDVPIYTSCGVKRAAFFEPSPEPFRALKEKTDPVEHYHAYNFALGNTEGIVDFNVANMEAASSILQPNLLHIIHPEISFPRKIQVPLRTLDSFQLEGYNFLNIDVQGYELEVLKGGKDTLNHIQYVLTEVNYRENYKNGCLIQDIDDFLSTYKLKRVATYDGVAGYWGDALYIKQT
jgi:FkbM family methyltransferase